MKYVAKYREPILWVTVAVLLFILFAKPCGRERVLSNAEDKRRADSLQSVVDAERQAKIRDDKADSITLANAHKQTVAAIEDKKASDRTLSVTQSTVTRLAQRLQEYKNASGDTSFTDTCLYLAKKVIEQDAQINDYRQQADEATELMNYEVVLRDSMIESEKAYGANLLAQFNAQATILKHALDAGKPRGRFLAGAGILGNKTNPLTGAKIAFAYQSKGGKQYQAGAAIVNKELLYEGTVLITLFK